jgi:hypothetical protein
MPEYIIHWINPEGEEDPDPMHSAHLYIYVFEQQDVLNDCSGFFA